MDFFFFFFAFPCYAKFSSVAPFNNHLLKWILHILKIILCLIKIVMNGKSWKQLLYSVCREIKYSAPFYFSHLCYQQVNLGLGKFQCFILPLFKNNCVWPNSKQGETVCECRRSKLHGGEIITLYKENPCPIKAIILNIISTFNEQCSEVCECQQYK